MNQIHYKNKKTQIRGMKRINYDKIETTLTLSFEESKDKYITNESPSPEIIEFLKKIKQKHEEREKQAVRVPNPERQRKLDLVVEALKNIAKVTHGVFKMAYYSCSDYFCITAYIPVLVYKKIQTTISKP